MKKKLLLLSLLCLPLWACGSEDKIQSGTYLVQDSDGSFDPFLVLDTEKKSFYFYYDLLSEDYCQGSYSVEKNKLYCVTEDEKESYIFSIEDEGVLSFDQGDSDDVTNSNGEQAIADGTKFTALQEGSSPTSQGQKNRNTGALKTAMGFSSVDSSKIAQALNTLDFGIIVKVENINMPTEHLWNFTVVNEKGGKLLLNTDVTGGLLYIRSESGEFLYP